MWAKAVALLAGTAAVARAESSSPVSYSLSALDVTSAESNRQFPDRALRSSEALRIPGGRRVLSKAVQNDAKEIELTVPGIGKVSASISKVSSVSRDDFKIWSGSIMGIAGGRPHKGRASFVVHSDGSTFCSLKVDQRHFECMPCDANEVPNCLVIFESARPNLPEEEVPVSFNDDGALTGLSGLHRGGPARALASEQDDDGSTIDVMVLYTEKSMKKYSKATLEAMIATSVADANEAYSNSGIDLRVDLVHMGLTTMEEANNLATTLDWLQSKDDGRGDDIHELRDKFGADLVTLVTEDGDACGVGYTMQTLSHSMEAFAFTVTFSQCLPFLTPAHEWGHVCGLGHNLDPGEDSSMEPAVFSYAHGWRNCGAWRTVMSYSCEGEERLPYFSSPQVLIDGVQTGAKGMADNALALMQTKSTVAAFRSHITPIAQIVDEGTSAPNLRVPPAMEADQAEVHGKYMWSQAEAEGGDEYCSVASTEMYANVTTKYLVELVDSMKPSPVILDIVAHGTCEEGLSRSNKTTPAHLEVEFDIQIQSSAKDTSVLEESDKLVRALLLSKAVEKINVELGGGDDFSVSDLSVSSVFEGSNLLTNIGDEATVKQSTLEAMETAAAESDISSTDTSAQFRHALLYIGLGLALCAPGLALGIWHYHHRSRGTKEASNPGTSRLAIKPITYITCIHGSGGRDSTSLTPVMTLSPCLTPEPPRSTTGLIHKDGRSGRRQTSVFFSETEIQPSDLACSPMARHGHQASPLMTSFVNTPSSSSSSTSRWALAPGGGLQQVDIDNMPELNI
jgi:hypothetical protein